MSRLTVQYGSTLSSSENNAKVPACKAPKKVPSKEITRCGRYQGISYAVLTGALFVITGSAVKYLKEYNVAELTLYRHVFNVVFSLPVLITKTNLVVKYDKKTVGLWIASSIFLTVAAMTRYEAFQMLPLGDASAIVFSSPFFTAVFARLILKDRLPWMTLLSLLVSLIGMALCVKLPLLIASGGTKICTLNHHLMGCLYALASVLLYSGWVIVTRFLRTVDPLINTIASALGGTIVCACFIPVYGGFRHPECSTISIATIMMCASCYGTVIFSTLALQTEDPTTVTTLVRSSDIILSFLVQIFFYHEAVDTYSLSGALLVFFAGMLLPWQRWMEGMSDDSRWKIKCLLK